MRHNFSANVRAVFDGTKYNFEEAQALMNDAGRGIYFQDDAVKTNKKIKDMLFEVCELNPEEKYSKRDIRRAIRRHKDDIFDVTETVIEGLTVASWGENPIFNMFVEMLNGNDGDANEFYIEDNTDFIVSEVSGNHHDIMRQRIGGGNTISVKTSWYAIKFYAEMEEFMTGRVDWARMIQKVADAFTKKINDMVYKSVMSAGDQLPGQAMFNISGTLQKDKVIKLIQDLEGATGYPVAVMGLKSAIAKLTDITPAQWISEKMKDERNVLGKVGHWEGTTVIEIPQVFDNNDFKKGVIAENVLMFIPMGLENRFVKVYNEGENRIYENRDAMHNQDGSYDYELQKKMGIAVIITELFGKYTISG